MANTRRYIESASMFCANYSYLMNSLQVAELPGGGSLLGQESSRPLLGGEFQLGRSKILYTNEAVVESDNLVWERLEG